MLAMIFTVLTIDRVIHKFAELFFHLGLGGGTVIGVLVDVGLQTA